MSELYGLRNCDSSRAARRWLAAHGIQVAFHDLREAPPSARTLQNWASQIGWQSLLNRRSKTWRNLPAGERAKVDEDKLVALLHAHPLLIKRPILVQGGKVHAGFNAAVYAGVFGSGT